MTKTLIGISISLAAGVLAAGAWFSHAPALLSCGAVQQARQQTEIERLRVKQRLLAVEEVRERQKSALLVARLKKEQMAAQTASRIDNAPEVIAARIRRRVMAEAWPTYAIFTVAAAGVGVLAFTGLRRVPFRHDGLETFVSRRQAACLAAQSLYLQGLSEQTRAQAFADETLRARVTAGVNVFSSMARAVRSAAHTALPTPEQAALPAAAPAVPSFAEMFQAGKFAAGKPLVFGFRADGQPRVGAWSHAYSLGIAGMSGSGKSSTIRLLMAESLLTGAVARFYVIDPHYPHPDSLLASLGALRDAPQVVTPATPLDTVAMLDEINARIDARLAGHEPSTPLLVVVIDELPVVVKTLPRVAALVERIGMESRKAGVYGMFSAQSWNGDKTGGTTARDNLTALIVHKMKRKQAHTLLQDADLTRQVLRLQPGQVLFSPTRGEPEVLTVPYCAAEDMPPVVSQLGAGVAPSATGTTQPASLSVDAGATPDATERNVGGDVIDFAAAREQRSNATPTVSLTKQPDTGALPAFPQDAQAAQLREFLQTQNVSLSKFADAAGVNKGLLSVFLRGEKRLSEAMLARVTAAMRQVTVH